MDTLKATLRSYLVERPQLGSPKASRDADKRHGLSQQLGRIGRTNQTYFNICYGAVVTLFVIACGVVLWFVNTPSQIAVVFGAMGVTITGLVAQMSKLWKQKVGADTLLALIPIADDEQLKTVINQLLKTAA